MKRCLFFISGIILLSSLGNADQKVTHREVASDSEVPLSYTHILQSTAVIPGGSFVVGTTVGFGMFDFIDFTTNLVYDIEGVFNIGTKVALYHDHNFAFAPYLSYSSQTYQSTDPVSLITTNVNSTAWEPGATFSYRLTSGITAHTGGTFPIRNPSIPKADVQNPRTALIQGNTGNQEFTFGFSRAMALSTGVSYDFTYDIFGAGASIHVSGLQIGAHYYFNVTQGNLLPILGAGYTGNF